ncbi:MAG: type I glutamate--ammonia ligase [Candidatus Bipolaricaulota bacterium]|nr:type I glutamate--ammonia ligase [Candidatus Bipolaricaulota bacterium]MDW8141354.1 type I glutamate--ammonia ligase [Candidatus Bipolaricaulota bacterium]
MSHKDHEKVLKTVKDEGINFIRLQFTDIFGIPKNVEIPAAKLPEVLNKGIAFDGSSIEGFMRISESDMYLQADPTTFAIYPWTLESGHAKTARIICDVLLPNGKPFEGDPRYVLRRAVAEAAKLGYTMYAGAEAEFFLFRRNGEPSIELHDRGGYFDLNPLDQGEETRAEIVVALEKMGFEVEAAHHEVAHSQHEIDFRYADVLKTADNIVTFRFVVKTIAMLHGLHATFMPKPIAKINGSGMHTHISLFKGGKNLFYDPKDSYNLSETARHFLAGIIEHIGAITALANPLVNSYKRLVPGYEAPVNISWARINRSALIRVPASNTPEVSTRIELRSPDPSCNPYLAYAAILAAGLDGIKRKLKAPDPVEENIYHLTREQRQERGIGSLPGSLDEALNALQSDEVIKSALGQHVLDKYIEAKEEEIQEYRLAVTPWELEHYLDDY